MKKYSIEGFIDNIKSGSRLGYKIFANNLDELENKEDYYYFVSIGDNEKRSYRYKEVIKRNLNIINVIDKTAILSENIIFRRGIFVDKLAIINNDARIVENIVINTKSLIEYGYEIGNNIN
jgi:UDP-3-O-[3-hydroxymyristoyl] glucosamine N-acyltransferase